MLGRAARGCAMRAAGLARTCIGRKCAPAELRSTSPPARGAAAAAASGRLARRLGGRPPRLHPNRAPPDARTAPAARAHPASAHTALRAPSSAAPRRPRRLSGR
eukprot:scaffold1723_cov104-Isochrysis_galbana.AAC.14